MIYREVSIGTNIIRDIAYKCTLLSRLIIASSRLRSVKRMDRCDEGMSDNKQKNMRIEKIDIRYMRYRVQERPTYS